MLSLLMRRHHFNRSAEGGFCIYDLADPKNFEPRTKTTAWVFAVSLRSLRVESHIERNCAIRFDHQLPFLEAKYRMPGFHMVGAGRKIIDGK